jgi:hypothetical protein
MPAMRRIRIVKAAVHARDRFVLTNLKCGSLRPA